MPPKSSASTAPDAPSMSSGLGGLRKEWKHPFRSQDGKVNLRTCWKWIITKLMEENATAGTRPMVPLEMMSEFKAQFLDPESGAIRELSEDQFVKTFAPLLKARMYTEDQLRRWFRDIDVDASEAVSWDEFTSFMIYQASSFGEDNHRSREMVPNLTPPLPAAMLHKDVVRRLASHSECDYFVSGGYDGLIKIWDPVTVSCVKTIHNTEMSAAHDSDTKGSNIGICPVSDLVFNAKGSHLFACATDKSITAYDMTNFSVWRRFLGRWKMNENGRRHVVGGLAECTTLMDMQDTPATMDIAAPKGKEVMYLGLQDGTIMAYPTSRTALLPQLQPYFSFKAHEDAITKIRYLPGVDGLMCSSWDKSLSLCNAETGAVMTRLDGGVSIRANVTREVVKHNKMAFDFDFNPLMRLVATVACEREVFLWNPNASSPVAILKGHATLLQAVAFDPVDRQMFSLDQDNAIKVWDLRMYRVCQTLNEGQVHATSSFMNMTTLRYDDKRSTLIGASHRLSTWTVRRAFSAFSANHSGHTESVVSVEYVNTTGTLLTADHNVIMTWNAMRGNRNIVFDPSPGEFGKTSCIGMDKNERRVYVAAKDGSTQSFNFRNGQKLREVPGKTTAEPIRVVQCSSADCTSKMMCVVSPNEVAVYGEVPGPSGILSPECDRVIKPTRKNVTFTVAVEYPSDNRATTGFLTLGTNNGQILLYSAVTGHLHAASQHPMRPKTRHHLRKAAPVLQASGAPATDVNTFLTADGARGASRELRVSKQQRTASQSPTQTTNESKPEPSLANATEDPAVAQQRRSAPLFNLPVEDLCYLPGKDLFVSCLGESMLYFWDLRRNVCKLAMPSGVTPEECILCVAAPPARSNASYDGGKVGEAFLITSDDVGVVYVRDISRIPHSRADNFDASMVTLLRVFKAHTSAITRLVAVTAPNSIVRVATLGADCFIKQFTITGRLVGFLGQKQTWTVGKPSTYAADAQAVIAPTDVGILPQPVALRTPTTVGGKRPTPVRNSHTLRSPSPVQPTTLGSFLTEPPSQISFAVPSGPANAVKTDAEAFEVIAVNRLPSPQMGTRPPLDDLDGDESSNGHRPPPTLEALRLRAAGGKKRHTKPSISAQREPATGAGGGDVPAPLGANSFGRPIRHALDHIRSGGATNISSDAPADVRAPLREAQSMKPLLTMHVKRIPGHGVPPDLCHSKLEIRPLTPAVVVNPSEAQKEVQPLQLAPLVPPRAAARRFRGPGAALADPEALRTKLGGSKSAPPGVHHGPMGPPSVVGLFRDLQMESTAQSRVEQQTSDAHSTLHSAPYTDDTMSLEDKVSQAILHDPRGWINRVSTLQDLAALPTEKRVRGQPANLKLLPESLLTLTRSPVRKQL